MKPALQTVAALRDRVERETLVRGEELDSQEPLSASLLPSRILFLLIAACAIWVAILTGAFLFFSGFGIGAGWIFAGAVLAALGCWTLLMVREIKLAAAHDSPEVREVADGELFLDEEAPMENRQIQDRMGNRLPFRSTYPIHGGRCPGLSCDIPQHRRDRTKSTGPI